MSSYAIGYKVWQDVTTTHWPIWHHKFDLLLTQQAIEMKKEKTCCRCTTKKKLSEFFLTDWYKDERICKHCHKLEVKMCCRCMTKKKLPEFFQRDRDKDESQCVCKDCRKLEDKVCNMCDTWKKRHSFKKEQWDLNDESYRICQNCFKIINSPGWWTKHVCCCIIGSIINVFMFSN